MFDCSASYFTTGRITSGIRKGSLMWLFMWTLKRRFSPSFYRGNVGIRDGTLLKEAAAARQAYRSS